MSIFILEDDVIQAEQLRKLVKDICLKRQIAYDFIEVTSKNINIINKIPFTSKIPIYFLDIEIKDEKQHGLEVAQEIRKYDSEGIIVFVTTHSEFAPISYQYMVSALTFIDKSLAFEKRYELFEQCLLHYDRKNLSSLPKDNFIVQNKNTTIKVPFSKVEYIKTSEAHRLILVTESRFIQFYGSLKEIESLDKRLLRCHQSFIVNMTQVESFNKKERLIILNSKKKIPVSRRLSNKVERIVRKDL